MESSYVGFIDSFIEPLAKVTGVSARKMVFCPGNHDISYKKLGARSIEKDGLFSYSSDTRAINSYYAQEKITEYAKDISSEFFEFTQYIDNSWKNPFYKIYEIQGRPIISLNAAFSCSEKGSKEDRGKLFFPVDAWDAAHREAGASVLATVMHFPLSELNEAHARELQAKIFAATEVLCFGHLHDPLPVQANGISGSHLALQSGALYEKVDRFKGYCLLQMEGSHSQIKYRTFYQGRRAFDVATNVASEGRFYPNKESETFWKSQRPTFSADQLESHLSGAVLEEVKKAVGLTLSGDNLLDVFVSPTFGEADRAKTEENGDLVEILRGLGDLKAADDHVCLQFPDETGATSFLMYLALQYAGDATSFAKPRIPVFIDLREVQASYQPAVERLIKAAYPVVEHAQFGWKARAEDQPFVLLIDNYDDRKTEHVNWLRQAHSLCPQARFLICAKSPFAGIQALRAASDLKIPFGHRSWALYPLDRKQVRLMVNQFSLPENINKNQVVEEIFSKFKTIGIPLSGPIVSMYLSVIKDKKKYSPVNTSAVLENFLEISLEKRESAVVFQDDFDYREQLNLLSVVAEKFIEMDTDFLSLEGCYDVINNHYKSTGVARNASEIITFFCNKGVMENVSNNIYFKYGMIFSYLVAHRMIISEEFRNFVFESTNIQKFIAEIDVYFGMNRNDPVSLGKISDHYSMLLRQVETEFGAFMDAKTAAKLTLPRTDKFENFVSTISERIVDQVEDNGEEDRDSGIQQEKDTPAQFIQKIKRADNQDVFIEWMKVLACYSVCIKNSEDFPIDVKTQHALLILEGWEKMTAIGIRIVGLLMSEGNVRVGDREFQFRSKSITDPRVIRALVASVPRYVSYYCNIYLASGKLEKTLRGLEVDGFAEFLKVGLLVDMRVDAFLKEVEKYQRRNENNTTLLESMMWKLRDSFMRFGLETGYIQSFQRVIVEMNADILGLKGDIRASKVGAMLAKLNAARLMKKMRNG